MTPAPKVSVRGLSKGFVLHKRRGALAGITTDSMKAFLTLLRQVALQRTTGAQEAGSGEIFYALSDIDFDVPAGEVLGVIGRNGAGKSTLLKILARTLNPTAGRIELRGRVVSLLELGIGFAPDLSLHENIQIHGRLAGFSAAAIDAAEGRILEFSRLEKYRDSLLERCPSGSFVRLAFSAMINLHADILLADEVLTVGDSDFRMQCEERIKDVGRSGQSVLFVSHDMNAIRRICTRVLWLDKGRIRMVGPTNAVVDTYTTELMAGRLLPAASSGSRSSTIIDLRLLDSDRSQTGALQMTKSAYVECIVRIDQPGATVFLEIELWNNKSHVFTTRPHQPLTAPSRATFRTSFLIPAHFLNEATYQLRARILVPDFSNIDGDLTIESEERLDFTAFNADPEQSVWADWQWGRSGIVSPRLHWSLKMQS